jgi:hypothetical protein
MPPYRTILSNEEQPRGKSPGWEKDKKRQKRKRYPVVKKRKSSEKKGKNNST